MTDKQNLEQKKQLLKTLLVKKVQQNRHAALASPAQNALWIFSQRYPLSPAYHLKFSAHINPGLDSQTLLAALHILQQRHSCLRSHFSVKKGQLYQCFADSLSVELIEKKIKEEEIESTILVDYAQPFALEAGPLLRAFLYFTTEEKQVFLLVIHHLVIDGISLLHLVSELGQVLRQEHLDWKPQLFTYHHYLTEQQQLQNTPSYAADLTYWLQHLHSVDGVLHLPYAQQRQNLPTYEGASLERNLSSDQVSALKGLAAHLSMTLHGLLLGVYHLMLHALSAQSLVLSVTPCLGHNRKEFLSIIGYFANMVVIKTQAQNNQSVQVFLKSCFIHLIKALEHQHVPFVKLVQALELDYNPKQLPLVQAAFAFHQPLASSQGLQVELYEQKTIHLHWANASVHPFRVPPSACQFDLYLVALEQTDGSISLNFEYMTDVFSQTIIAELAEYFMQLTAVVLDDVTQDLTNLPKISKDSQWEERLRHLNATEKKIPNETATRLCHQALLDYATNTAVIDAHGTYTYRLVHRLANGLALLLPKNVHINAQPIGILLEKGIQQIVAVLATLWTGNYFVPININNPLERIKSTMQQASMRYLISTESLMVSHHLTEVSFIDVNQARPVDDFTPITVSPDDLAYVIFTSGTTGIPKGVAISHRSLLNTVLAINEQFAINERDRFFALSDLSFDLAMYDVFGGLIAGAGLVFCAQDQIKEPKQWLQLITQHQITVWNSVPMLLSMLLEQSSNALPLEHIFLSGDWIRVELVKKAHEYCPKAQVVSLGGPTETTIWSIGYPLDRGVLYEFIPYGYPLPNHRYYVLNEQLQHCRLDEVGELYAAGMGLAQSYLNDPEKTAQAFIYHPVYGRLYRTGDLGELTADYGIRIKGRSDRQVKIGGYRIELDDVRLALERCFPKQIVTCHASGDWNNKRLVAFIQMPAISDYVVFAEAAKTFPQEYQQLQACLPDYMIPEIFVGIHAIPLNKNNKIDYQSLPGLQRLQAPQATMTLNPMQHQIAFIWSAALDVPIERIGLESHFFHLGGDSLSAVAVIRAVDKVFQLSCSLNLIFESPTLMAFCDMVAQQEPEREQALAVQAHSDTRYNSFALTPVQHAYWIGRQQVIALGGVGSHSYYEFDLPKVKEARFQLALDAVIRDHDMLRMIITSEGKQQILEKVPSYPLAVITQDLDAVLASTREALSHEVLAMNAFPSFRVILFQYESMTRVVMSYDALQFDAWSFLIFLRELAEHYTNPEKNYRPTSIQFRDYVLYLEQLTQTRAYAQAKLYWSERLLSLPYGPQLPVQQVTGRPVFQRLTGHLPKKQWDKLVTKAQDSSCTPTCLVLSAFALVVRHYSRKPEFCLNLTLFNRANTHEELDSLIGDFTSLILLEVKSCEAGFSFAAFLAQLQAQLIADLEHRHYDGVQVQRDLRRMHPEESTLIAPVVFTSTLGFVKPDFSLGSAKINYSITQTPQVWLDHQIREDKEGLHWVWDYLQGVFDDQTISCMHQQFLRLLDDLVTADWDDYQMPMLLPEAQVRLDVFNATAVSPPNISLTAAVAQSCLDWPQQVAIIDDLGSLTYQNLMTQALGLAQCLAGYPSNSPIGVLLAKGRDQVIACLAILFSGHHFVPFSLANPIKRLHVLMQESEVLGVITTNELAKTYRLQKQLVIDVFSRGENVQPLVMPEKEDTAYVIYTSGSTGTPKGVVISHHAVLNTLLDINARFVVDSSDKVLALSDLSFDLAIYDIFGLLLAGGCIVFPKQELVKEPDHWQALIVQHSISLWNSVPMFYAMLLHSATVLPTLKIVLLSGDWIMPELASKGFSLCPNARISALGGATECSIWSNSYVLHPQEQYEYIPYGYPLSNQQFYVLHHDLSLCPEGVEGELYIGGLGLAKEYYRDKKKTAQSFIHHPELGRLYRTGDWGMMTLDRGVKFLGRQDSQVKIGGYRIDINEVEHSIRQCLALDELVVNVQIINKTKRLVAYAVIKGQQAEKIQQQLAQKDTGFDGLSRVDIPQEVEQLAWFRRKSYRFWNEQALDAQHIHSLLQKEIPLMRGDVLQEQLIKALQQLAAINTSDLVLPKYRFPSAGSLYPVRCYISLNHGGNRGCHFFSPVTSHLIQISEHPMNEVDEVFFIVDPLLIQPYYPKTWRIFCDIEAGHMASLISQFISLQVSVRPFKKELIQLTEHQLLLAQFQLGGSEEFQPQISEYQLIMNCEQIVSLGINQKMVSSAAGFITFAKTVSPFTIGWWAQSRMDVLISEGIGSCYIGSLDINHQKQLAIAFGAVDSELIASRHRSNNAPSAKELIDQAYTYLQAELPSYMIPADIMVLESLPLNANGKVDKSKLPQKEYQSIDGELIDDAFELQVASLWQKTLKRSEPVLYSTMNFFALGGDSLTAMELLSLLKEELGIQADLSIIFKFPELKVFCEQLRMMRMNQLLDSTPWVCLKSAPSEQPLMVLVHPGTGTIDCYLSFSSCFKLDYELVAIQFKQAKAKDLYELAAEYAAYLMTHYAKRRIHLLGYSLGVHIAFEMAKILDAQGFSYETLSLVDAKPIVDSNEIFYETTDEMNLLAKVLVHDYRVSKDQLDLLLKYIQDRQNTLLSLCVNYKTLGRVKKPIFYFNAQEATPYLKTKARMLHQREWGSYCTSKVTKHTVKGNHMNIFSQQYSVDFYQIIEPLLSKK